MNKIFENEIQAALWIAEKAHEGQFRKWGGDPYIVHPKRVAEIVRKIPGTNDTDIAAALLHDVIEDRAIPVNSVDYWTKLIEDHCGSNVLKLVWELTNPTHGPEWKGIKREYRKVIDRYHLSKVSEKAKLIKLADRLDNISDMVSEACPMGFKRKYVIETYQLLDIIQHVNIELSLKIIDKLVEIKNQKGYKFNV